MGDSHATDTGLRAGAPAQRHGSGVAIDFAQLG